MKNILFLSLLTIIFFNSCGPAAEDRKKMHERAAVFQDSIANFIRSSMAEAEAPGPMMMPPAVQPTAAPQATSSAPQQPKQISPNVGVNQTPGQQPAKSK
jgi:hypothetical protein